MLPCHCYASPVRLSSSFCSFFRCCFSFFGERSTRALVKPLMHQNTYSFHQTLTGACVTIDMSGGGGCGWLRRRMEKEPLYLYHIKAKSNRSQQVDNASLGALNFLFMLSPTSPLLWFPRSSRYHHPHAAKALSTMKLMRGPTPLSSSNTSFPPSCCCWTTLVAAKDNCEREGRMEKGDGEGRGNGSRGGSHCRTDALNLLGCIVSCFFVDDSCIMVNG